MGIASTAVRLLIKQVEMELDHVWREMRNFPWPKLETVVDQSSYVPELVRVIQTKVRDGLQYLHKQQYARAYCDNLVETVAILPGFGFDRVPALGALRVVCF